MNGQSYVNQHDNCREAQEGTFKRKTMNIRFIDSLNTVIPLIQSDNVI
jgi:hypothetical protein